MVGTLSLLWDYQCVMDALMMVARKSWLLVRHWAVRVRRAGKAFYL